MALSLQQVQKQSQRLIMTPQMQQSIQLLQKTMMELEQHIRQEMLSNPFLELADDEDDLRTEDSGDGDDTPQAELSEPESGLSDEAKSSDIEYDDEPYIEKLPKEDFNSDGDPVAESTESSEDFQRLAESDINWDEEFGDGDATAYGNGSEDDEDRDFTTYTSAKESLLESLNRQLHLSILGGENFQIGEFIIGNLNNDGYLDCSLENICLMLGLPPELIDPENAGPVEKVDETLRRFLAKLHEGENPDAFKGMKRREVITRVIAGLLKKTYDQVSSMKKEEQYRRLIARQLKVPYKEIASVPATELILDAIAKRMNTDRDTVFDVLDVIQEFEPTGIAARDLAECLRLQCEERGIRNRVLYEILDGHLSDLQQKRFREIARAMGVSENDVVEVFDTLSKLDPKPGRGIAAEEVQHIVPDVYVKKVDGKYLYFLNEGDAGRLKVASSYRRLLVNSKGRGRAAAIDPNVEPINDPMALPALEAILHSNGTHAATNGTHAEPKVDPAEQISHGGALIGVWEDMEAPEEKTPTVEEFNASEKFKSAKWLIHNIEKRKQTVLRVTEAIMEYQKEFLDKGIEALRPLTLRDIAEVVRMHESTIARVTTKKYVETPRGIFELKFFFSSGLETDDGEAASSRSIKELLTQMIDAEDKRRPLSDQKIADMLRAKGFQIARRTVAKYREQLKILPAKLRKEVRETAKR